MLDDASLNALNPDDNYTNTDYSLMLDYPSLNPPDTDVKINTTPDYSHMPDDMSLNALPTNCNTPFKNSPAIFSDKDFPTTNDLDHFISPPSTLDASTISDPVPDNPNSHNENVDSSVLSPLLLISCTDHVSPIPSQYNLWQCLNKGGGGHKEDEHKTYTTDPGIKCGITSPKNNYTESDDPNATSSTNMCLKSVLLPKITTQSQPPPTLKQIYLLPISPTSFTKTPPSNNLLNHSRTPLTPSNTNYCQPKVV
eukprot:CAMPEP_0172483112 /NCGR_PEP_ID=MMETSP1066-20121228/9938_1 /TAXON_ID=671091 /ORGANISM="Coscinodiscus wailesii, Strain CCMP2513" /LENGTH=252 /DNA_ID=CAMNT_0013246789 /DNA_START=178 /DNA_END=935 /DNA_ORIENTATION=-